MVRIGLGLACAFAAALGATQAAAQTDKAPIRILVGVQPGASLDLIARQVADKLRDSLGEPAVVDNRPGAGQRIALAELKKAPPDGRTMMVAASAAFSLLPHIYGDRLGYDPVKDFTPLTRAANFAVGIAAGPQSKAKNVAEFVDWAKANSVSVSYGSPGGGTSSHFAGLLLAKALGMPMAHVAYKGGAPALTDLMGGHIQLVSTSFSDLPELHRAGKIQIIATAGPKRSPAVPEVMTLREQGVDVAFDVGFDMYSSANVPPDVVKRLNAALVQAIQAPDTRAKFDRVGLEAAGSTAEELAAKQAAETKLWAEPVKASGFKGE
jgi:tripartite-type tricarboxylate transporter receptor subunit TctC